MKLIFFLAYFIYSFHDSYLDNKMIVGQWVLEDKKAINYPTITFNDNATAILTSKGDTIYRFQYQINKDSTIELTDIKGDKYYNRIIKLNNDRLIFDGLINLKGKQVYIKK